jgi:hypothetical protein
MRAVESMPYCTVDAPATRGGERARAALAARDWLVVVLTSEGADPPGQFQFPGECRQI